MTKKSKNEKVGLCKMTDFGNVKLLKFAFPEKGKDTEPIILATEDMKTFIRQDKQELEQQIASNEDIRLRVS